MTYEGYLSFGGAEIINNERVRAYARTASCPLGMIKGGGSEALYALLGTWPADAVGGAGGSVESSSGTASWMYQNIADAPWYDGSAVELSSRFFGCLGLEVKGFVDSTRKTELTEGIEPGGTMGMERLGPRETRYRAVLVARGGDALDYGFHWLSAALSVAYCGTHGSSCRTSDALVLADIPPVIERGALVEDYKAAALATWRVLHDVATVSGPIEAARYVVDGAHIAEVEWTITSERPWVYDLTRYPDLPEAPMTMAADIPYNLARFPSAELSSGTVVVSTNYAVNPSLGTNDTSWARSYTAGVPAAFISAERSADLAAHGTHSYRVRLLGDAGVTPATNATGWIRAYQDVPISILDGRTRVSLSVWGAAILSSGAAGSAILELRAYVDWLDSGTTLLRTDIIESVTGAAMAGNVFMAKSVLPPEGAARARVYMAASVRYSSSATPANNSDIRLYTDALAVTVP